jgi:glycosyltransferase involved in cell wall biosynthesis
VTASLKTLFPGRTRVRGDWIAVDYLTEALLQYGTADRYDIFVSPDFLPAATASIASRHQDKVRSDKIRIVSSADLLNGIDDHHFTTFFAPQGLTATAFHTRGLGSKLYPVTLVSHGLSGNWQIYHRFLRILLSPTYPCDTIICTSRASRAVMASIFDSLADRFNREFHCQLRYTGRLDVIPLCIDTEKFRPHEKASRRRLLGLPKDALIVLFLGRISPVKAELLPLLRVFHWLTQRNPAKKLHLVIAGTQDPRYGRVLEEQIRLLFLSDHVGFLHDLTDEQKLCLLQASDIFVSPADGVEESFGVAPVEAMACGIPQIVSDWNGYRDTVSHGETGFLVPTYWTRADSDLTTTGILLGMEFDSIVLGGSIAVDVDSLQSHLQVMIENDQLREDMSRRSTQRAHALFSFASVVKRYEELWSELSQIAHPMTVRPKQSSIEIPHYFDSFRGHASSILSDDCYLGLTPLGRGIRDTELELLLRAQNLKFNVIDEQLIRIALSQLRDDSERFDRAAVPTAGITFGRLAAILGKQSDRHPDFARRHVMWLIKHGLLSPEVGA